LIGVRICYEWTCAAAAKATNAITKMRPECYKSAARMLQEPQEYYQNGASLRWAVVIVVVGGSWPWAIVIFVVVSWPWAVLILVAGEACPWAAVILATGES